MAHRSVTSHGLRDDGMRTVSYINFKRTSDLFASTDVRLIRPSALSSVVLLVLQNIGPPQENKMRQDHKRALL